MANDITLAISDTAIKNGTLVLCDKLGNKKTVNTYVKNTPAIGDIEDKYDNRFDDPSYYYGIGSGLLVGG